MHERTSFFFFFPQKEKTESQAIRVQTNKKAEVQPTRKRTEFNCHRDYFRLRVLPQWKGNRPRRKEEGERGRDERKKERKNGKNTKKTREKKKNTHRWKDVATNRRKASAPPESLKTCHPTSQCTSVRGTMDRKQQRHCCGTFCHHDTFCHQ